MPANQLRRRSHPVGRCREPRVAEGPLMLRAGSIAVAGGASVPPGLTENRWTAMPTGRNRMRRDLFEA